MIQKIPLTRHPISNEAEYRAALRELGSYFDGPEIDPESARGQYFLALATLVEEYEKKHYPISQEDQYPAEQRLLNVRAGRSVPHSIDEVDRILPERQQPETQEREPLKFSQEDRDWLDFPGPDPDSSR